MSHLTTTSVTLGLGALLLGGCASHGPVSAGHAATQPQTQIMVEPQTDDTIALAAIQQSIAAERDEPCVFHLGAGDALGQAVFVTYVAYLRDVGPEARDGMRYVTGADDRPE